MSKSIMLSEALSIQVNFEERTIEGDVNTDGVFSVADVVFLQKWLFADPNVTLADRNAGDICTEGTPNVFDLCLLKQKLIENQSVFT